MKSYWRDWSREDLVKEYIETRLASVIEHVGVDWRFMPVDVNQDPAYWKAKDKDLHDMHFEIAEKYHIKRDDCLWLENVADSDNLYLTKRKLKPLIDRAIRDLERLEKEEEKRKQKTHQRDNCH